MPTLICSCGRSVQITESEATNLMGELFSCPACGKSKRIPTFPKTTANAMSDSEKVLLPTEQLRKPQYGISSRVTISLLLVLVGIGAGVGWVLFLSNSSTFPQNQAGALAQPGGIQGGNNPKENPGLIGGLFDEMSTKSGVRKYLKKNLNDPDFDEVKWWPSHQLKNAFEYTPSSNSNNVRLFSTRTHGSPSLKLEVQ